MAEDFEINPQDPSLVKSGFTPLVNGTYELIIAEMPTLYQAQGGDQNTGINVKYVVADHPNHNVFDTIYLTPNASWKIAAWLNAMGKGEKVTSVYLKSEEFRKSIINTHLTADLGTHEAVGKNGGIMLVNSITNYVHSESKPRPVNPGTNTVTSSSPAAQALKAQMAASNGSPVNSADKPLSTDDAIKALAF